MDNYTSVTNNKLFYHTSYVAVEEKPESLIISLIESNVETQSQIKPKNLQKEINCLQRKELSEKDEASMDAEVKLLQQRFNKIELEKAKEKKLHS